MARNTWTGWTAVLARDDAAHGWVLSREAAKYIANAMAYDDIIRVADLKTRAPPLRPHPQRDAGEGRRTSCT